MTEEYAEGFARAYDEHWHPYPTRAAAHLLDLHRTLAPDAERRLLDVGCGTGIVAAHFQQAGYRVTGLDVSRAMLARARERLGEQATLIHGDAADFTLPETYPFAVSIYDIPNHLGDTARYTHRRYAATRSIPPRWLGMS